MKKKFIIISVILLIIGGVGFWAYQKLKSVSGDISEKVEELTKTQEISVSAITISDIAPTNQLKVLSMYKEVLVQSKKVVKTWGGIVEDNQQLCAIYPAELDFGLDFSEVDINEVFRFRNDSLIVNLPEITILNKDGLSVLETSRRTAIEIGDSWTSDERHNQKEVAQYLMLRSCEMDDCWDKAEAQAVDMIKESLGNLGFKKVNVSIPHRKYIFFWAYKQVDQTLPFVLMKYGSSDWYLTDVDGYSRLEWSGKNSYHQLFTIWDYFVYRTKSSRVWVQIKNDGTNLTLNWRHLLLFTQEDKQQKIDYYNSTPKVREELYKVLTRLYGDNVNIKVVATDYNGNVFYTF